MPLNYQNSNFTSSAPQLRKFRNREFLVSPAVLLVEGVVNNHLALAEEFGGGGRFAGWNGVPVTLGHPKRNGEPVSANSPEVLEEVGIGHVFGASMDGEKLKGELWVDIALAEAHPDGRIVLENQRRAMLMEISTGLLSGLDASESGTRGGKAFKDKFINIVPDHVALLLHEKGACDNNDGCGVPRINATDDCPCSDTEGQSVLKKFMNLITSDGKGDKSVSKETTTPKAVKALAKQLIDHEHSMFNTEDRPMLFACSEQQLEALAARLPKAEDKKTLDQKASEIQDPELQAYLMRALGQEKDEKATLITSLVAEEACKFSKETLDKWDIDDLQTLEKSLPAPNYQGAAHIVGLDLKDKDAPLYYDHQPLFPAKKTA
jgi:hypothetical protein